jgi:epoxyqueuosine reductase
VFADYAQSMSVDPLTHAPSVVTTDALVTWMRSSLEIDAVGVIAAEPYERDEAAIQARGARGLFADMRFTMAQPGVSCHPERLLESHSAEHQARSIISAALCYWHPDAPPAAPQRAGMLPRYTRRDYYQELIDRLEIVTHWLKLHGHEARVLVDDNAHLDRAAAVRSGVGFAGKHTNVITREFGSWVVLGTIATSANLETTAPMRPGCGSCTACIDACPTNAIETGTRDDSPTLDATRCVTTWTQSRRSIPPEIRTAMGPRAYGCDICQDVCPWNRGVEKRRANEEALPATVDLVSWLQADEETLRTEFDRLFVPRNDMRYLRRNAIVALAHSGAGDAEVREIIALLERMPDDDMLREHGLWAMRMIGGREAAEGIRRFERA